MAYPESLIEQYPGVYKEWQENFKGLEPVVTMEALSEQCGNNEHLKNLLNEMLNYCYRYAEDVCKMDALRLEGLKDRESAEQFEKMDEARTRLHNAMIDSVNILARALAKEGKDNSWIDKLAAGSRPAYARFALLTAYREVLKWRKEVEDDQSQ